MLVTYGTNAKLFDLKCQTTFSAPLKMAAESGLGRDYTVRPINTSVRTLGSFLQDNSFLSRSKDMLGTAVG